VTLRSGRHRALDFDSVKNDTTLGHTGAHYAEISTAGETAKMEGHVRVNRSRPQISVEDAMAELDAMIGLTPVKEQVRLIAASIEASRQRAVAGIATKRPMWHFVFLGASGTGKTTVARVLAKIVYAFGLLEMPNVIEANWTTAIETNELVDSALGGVLFIDEAYRLVPEAVQTLLKRAEDDREILIIILAGYEKQMEVFLASHRGLASLFTTLKFPGYSPAEMTVLAESGLSQRGDELGPDARPVLWRIFEEVDRRRVADELGNGWFVRSLLEKAGQARDVRVLARTAEPSREDLVTIHAGDLERAFSELMTSAEAAAVRFNALAATATPVHQDDAGVVSELERLSALHSAGALNDEEFRAAKARVLGAGGN
jgi:adenylate kinase family enzyme